MYSFLLCNRNFVFMTRRFSDIRLQKMLWPWNRVKGHSRSLKVVPFDRDRLCMVSYYCSLVTLSLKRTFYEIRLVSTQWPWNPGLRSLKVIENDTIRSGTHDFLLMLDSNHWPISHRFRDKRWFPLKCLFAWGLTALSAQIGYIAP